MKIEWTKDFREFVALLNAHRVKYVLLGGYRATWMPYRCWS